VVFLLERFRDPKHGGFFWKTDLSGRVQSDRKILYGHLFATYALVEYFRASGDPDALGEARSVYELLEQRAHDEVHGGWVEHFRRNWNPIRRPKRGVDVEVPGLKSANTHLHAMEVLTELYLATGERAVEVSLAETVDLSTTYFYPEDPRTSSLHRGHDWSFAGLPGVSHGHNVEFAWLLRRADTSLGRESSWRRFDAYLSHALADPRAERVWWVEAEMLAALTIATLSRHEVQYEEALEKQLAFLLAHQIDPVDGIWLETVAADGQPMNATKVGTWKDAYHDVRSSALFVEAFGDTATAEDDTPEARSRG
jgi:mannobiose 2-epimerase